VKGRLLIGLHALATAAPGDYQQGDAVKTMFIRVPNARLFCAAACR
jgi:hypothetical protein